jgi:hypothetical protein
MSEKQDMQAEGEALAQRFASVKNRAAWAREVKFPGGASMIYQNIKGLKPISLKAAALYAKKFGCGIQDISPYWGRQLAKMEPAACEPVQKYGSDVVNLESRRVALSPLQSQLFEIVAGLDDIALAMLIGRAQEIAAQRTAPTAKKRGN